LSRDDRRHCFVVGVLKVDGKSQICLKLAQRATGDAQELQVVTP
jgi:hypothetical protein